MTKPVVVILIGAFWPGNDSSGPNLSIRAQCEALGDQFDFRIIARDRPFGADTAMAKPGEWHDLGYARIAYLPVGRLGAEGLIAHILAEKPSLIILNGFFDREFTNPVLLARRFGRLRGIPCLLSPRGEFSSGALALKAGQKSVFLKLAAALGLHNGLAFHATSEEEVRDIARALPGNPVTLVTNFRPLFAAPPHVGRANGEPLRLMFLARIARIKGLDIALNALAKASAPAHLSIYGPVGDADYWHQCEQLIAALPRHVGATWHGEIANDDAPATLAAHDLFVLPSLSENFGHAIFEALASGTPVIIGDQTPWRHLASISAGWDLPVGDVQAVAERIDAFAAMSGEERLVWRDGAREKARSWAQSNDSARQMSALFQRLIDKDAA